jgi:type II secretory pathway pseudopilin PulG
VRSHPGKPMAGAPALAHALTSSPRRRERAVGLVEIIVVTLILGIIGSIAITGIRSAGRDRDRDHVAAALHQYADASREYAADHGGRMPAPGTDAWPSESLLQGPVASGGMTEPRPYAPALTQQEAVTLGLLTASSTANSDGARSWRLDVQATDVSTLEIRAVPLRGDDWTCTITVSRGAEEEATC